MPEGCLDRSTGWLPSSPGSAIRATHATSAAPRRESGPNPRPKWAGKERARHGFEGEFEIRVFYRDRERSWGGGKAGGRELGLSISRGGERRRRENEVGRGRSSGGGR